MSHKTIEFNATDGTTLRGFLYTPKQSAGTGKLPCVILSHGMTGVIGMDLDLFAEYFTTHLPINALIYDQRCFGSSDGKPRYEALPSLQMSDLQDAITFAQSLEQVNPGKIAIWGTSYSGGHCLQVAAFDRRVKAVLVQAPVTYGSELARRFVRIDHGPTVQRVFEIERRSRMKGEQVQYLPVVAEDPYSPCALPGLDSWEFFEAIKDGKAVQWRNEVTTRSIEMLRTHNPGFVIQYIAPTPLLMTVADADTLTPPDLILKAYNEAREPKEIQFVKGSHWDIYGGSEFEKNVKTQAAFLKKYLLSP